MPTTKLLSQRIVYAHCSLMTNAKRDSLIIPANTDTLSQPGTTHSVTVGNTSNMRLDRLLTDNLSGLSRSRVKKLIETGNVTCDGKTITEPSHRVKHSQNFTIFIPEAAPAIPQPQSIALNVKFEDEDLIVIDKPAGLVVHPAPGNTEGTLVNALLAHCGDSLSGIGGVKRPGIVHRLDKNTSGLMIAAKNDHTHENLSGQFEARTVERAYLAIVWGVPNRAKGEITGNIGRSPRNRKKMTVRRNGGKPALTRYKIIRRFGTIASMIECQLATGRTHQIRVHLSHSGYPVIGDTLYGGGTTTARKNSSSAKIVDYVAQLNRQALHAKTLGFNHPRTGENLRFESPFPPEINELRELLE